MIDPRRYDQHPAALPEAAAEDFQPWVNPDQARRAGKTLDQAAADAAQLWNKALQTGALTNSAC